MRNAFLNICYNELQFCIYEIFCCLNCGAGCLQLSAGSIGESD